MQNTQKLYIFFVDYEQKECYNAIRNRKGGVIMYNNIDPIMTFGEVLCYYEDYAKRARSCGRKPVSFLRFLTGRF